MKHERPQAQATSTEGQATSTEAMLGLFLGEVVDGEQDELVCRSHYKRVMCAYFFKL